MWKTYWLEDVILSPPRFSGSPLCDVLRRLAPVVIASAVLDIVMLRGIVSRLYDGRKVKRSTVSMKF
jgi:hypothetical protein